MSAKIPSIFCPFHLGTLVDTHTHTSEPVIGSLYGI